MYCILLLLLGVDSTAHVDSFRTVTYQGQEIVYDLERELIFIYDSARVEYDNIVLCADTVVYYLKTNTLDAYPKCALSQADDTVRGTFLHYNIKNKKALIKQGKSRIDKGFFSGNEVYWIDQKTFNIRRGRYTTCEDSIPHYYFYAPKMKVFLNDMVIAEPISLCVRGIPLVFAPFWFVPIARERKSGLLPFKAGSSSLEGKYIKQFAYYWVTNEYSDVTFMIDVMEKKGVKPQAEAVWVYRPYTSGNLLASYIDETDTKQKRYSVSGRSSSEKFILGSTMAANLDFVSDKSYLPDYAVEKELWLKKEATSSISISRSLPFGSNSVSAYRRQDFERDQIDERLPQYSITTTPFNLLGVVSSQVSGTAIRQRTVRGDTTRRNSAFGVNSTPSVSQNVLGLFTISPSVTLDYAMFDQDRYGRRWPGRFAYSFGTSATSNLFRVFSADAFGMHGVLHKVSPSLAYRYTPDFDFSRFYPVAGIGSYGYQNAVDFGIGSEFEAKVGKDEIKRRLLGMNVSSGYNFKSDSLGSVALSFDTYYNVFPPPCTSFALRAGASINPYDYEYGYNIDNSFQFKIKDQSLTIGQTYVRNGDYQVSGQLGLKPTRKWALAFAATYNVTRGEIVSRSLSLNRDLHCWEAVFTFNTLGNEWVYDFMIRIKAIPEISIGRGTLGFLLP